MAALPLRGIVETSSHLLDSACVTGERIAALEAVESYKAKGRERHGIRRGRSREVHFRHGSSMLTGYGRIGERERRR